MSNGGEEDSGPKSAFGTFDNSNLLDPGDLAQFANEGSGEFWGRANSYTCPLGADWGEAWILLSNTDWRALDKDKFSELQLVDENSATITIPKLMPLRGWSVWPTENAQAEQPILVQLVDCRYHLNMSAVGKWTAGSGTGVGQYNVRYPYADNAATGADLFYPESLSGGAQWTWEDMFENLWSLLPSVLAGPHPTIPFNPDGNPEGFRFLGVSCWQAIQQMLSKIRAAIQYDPFQDVFSVVQLGEDQPQLAARFADKEPLLRYDIYPTDGIGARIPEKVRVFFRRSNYTWGATSDVKRGDSAVMKPYISVDVPSGVTGAYPETVVPLWDDLTALHSISGSLTNGAALTARAEEVAAQYINTLKTSNTKLTRQYNGYHPEFLPGSEVKSVSWSDYGDGAGPTTTVVRFHGLHAGGMMGGAAPEFPSPGSAEQLLPPNLGRLMLFSHGAFVCKAPSGIPLRDPDDTPGSGIVHLHEFNGTKWVDVNQEMTAYNLSGSAVAADTFLVCVYADGVPLVIFESCETPAPP